MTEKFEEQFISLVMVTNDRAEDLKECLGTVRQYVRHAILVDTGLDTEALELAKTFDCIVRPFELKEDMSAARNYGLSQVETKWVLIMDGDEVFDPNAIVKFHWLMENRPHSAYMIEVHDLKAVARVPQIRFFRKDGRLEYRGIYGEVPDLVEGFEPDQDYFANSSAIIYNQRRQDAAKEREAYAARIELYKRKLIHHPNDLFMMFRLGLDLEYLGRYKDAIELYREVAEKDGVGIFPLAVRNLAICLQYQRKVDMAINVLSRGLKRFPDYTDLGFELGMMLMKSGDLKTAEGVFKQCKDRGDAPVHYPSIPGTGGALADFGSGLVAELSGESGESQLVFSAALDTIKENSLQLLYLGTILRRMYDDTIAKKTYSMLANLEDKGARMIYRYLFEEEAPTPAKVPANASATLSAPFDPFAGNVFPGREADEKGE